MEYGTMVWLYGGFLKWCYPTTMGFPTKNDHFGVFRGYHHLRKHPYANSAIFFNNVKGTSFKVHKKKSCFMKYHRNILSVSFQKMMNIFSRRSHIFIPSNGLNDHLSHDKNFHQSTFKGPETEQCQVERRWHSTPHARSH